MTTSHLKLLGIATMTLPMPGFSQTVMLDGVTFAGARSVIYVPAREATRSLGLKLGYSASTKTISISDRPIADTKTLFDGTMLVSLRALRELGLEVQWDQAANEATLRQGDREVLVRRGEKRVVISKAEQRLRAFQGDRLIIETNVSTGRRGHTTPSGTWPAGPEKAAMRRSSLYGNSPMPWAVQVNGHIFIHGYDSVPPRPASHGCVRMPLTGRNPAKWFFNWVDIGTPITIE
jgi:hypothetical protein